MGWNPFDGLSEAQRRQLQAYRDLLLQFNRSINLISREDEGAVEEHHLLHCLTLRYKAFPPGTSVVDWGTGGGLPAIPLAIAFPDVTFHAVDAVEKKVQAVRTMARRLGLANLQPWHGRAEAWPGRTAYSVSRATAPLVDLWTWHRAVYEAPAVAPASGQWRPGLVCLKGGDLAQEIGALQRTYPSVVVESYPLSSWLGRPYFAEKCLLEVYDVEQVLA